MRYNAEMPDTPSLFNASDSSLPALTDGTSTPVGGLVTNLPSPTQNLALDVGLALVVAIAAPLLLKRALETEVVSKMFRFPASKQGPPVPKDYDFDSD